MTKKAVLVLLVLALMAAPVFAGFRADLGINVPFGSGVYSGGTLDWKFFGSGGSFPVIPIPEVGLSYQVPLGFIHLGVGIRALPLIVANVAWPNAYAEFNLGPVVLEAQVGGGAIGYYIAGGKPGLYTGAVLLPDVSVWLAPGPKRSFRIGVGALGIMTSSDSFKDITSIPVGLFFYGGVKFVINP
jgi:hypothetical protein